MSRSWQPHGLQPARLPCPSLSPRVGSNSCPLSQWWHSTISSSVTPFSSCPQSFPASGSFPMSWLFTSGSQSIEALALASVLPWTVRVDFFRINWFDLPVVQGTLKSLLQHQFTKSKWPAVQKNQWPRGGSSYPICPGPPLSRPCREPSTMPKTNSCVPICRPPQSVPVKCAGLRRAVGFLLARLFCRGRGRTEGMIGHSESCFKKHGGMKTLKRNQRTGGDISLSQGKLEGHVKLSHSQMPRKMWDLSPPPKPITLRTQQQHQPEANAGRSFLVKMKSGIKVSAATAAKSLQSCLTLCDPGDGSPPGSPVPGTLQARTPEWVAISFSNAWKWKVKGKSLSRIQLLATPWTAAYQAPPSMGFSRQEYWSGVTTKIWGEIWRTGAVTEVSPGRWELEGCFSLSLGQFPHIQASLRSSIKPKSNALITRSPTNSASLVYLSLVF